jgi:hypothetical protein
MSEQYENLTADEMRQMVDERLAAWKVAYAVRYAGEQVKRDWGGEGKGQTVDAFRVSFGTFETDFYMGTGNRKLSKSDKALSPELLIQRAFGIGHGGGYIAKSRYDQRRLAEAKRRLSKPVNPRAADVLYCLLADAEACDMSHSDWCDSFGYDVDSIKALRIHQACEETSKELRRILSREQMTELRGILQNF